MHRFFVPSEQISKDTITITGSDVNHIKNVLRMHTGDRLEAFDGAGNSFMVKIISIGASNIQGEIINKINSEIESSVKITLAQCLPKAKKMDFIVQKATELGACGIIPVISERSVPKIEDKADKKVSHWQMIAKEAAEQSGRTVIPKIGPLTKFEDLIKIAKNYDLAIIPWEGERTATLSTLIPQSLSTVLVIIGPEGGFSQQEVNLAISGGFDPISLGKRILRTETAGIVALSQIYYELGD